MLDLKDQALTLFKTAVDRADPAQALHRQFQLEKPTLPRTGGRLFLLAVGKAACPMLREALKWFPAPYRALAITNPENLQDIQGATVITGSHPIPDTDSEEAGLAALDLLKDTTKADLVITLISGGGSALMVAAAEGLSLADKVAVNELLLSSGMEIQTMNLVRQQLSALKGGGLLRAAAPASVTSYILSDVVGDDLRAIASGPTVSPLGSRNEAMQALMDAGLWDRVSFAVRELLSKPLPSSPLPDATNILVGSNRQSLDAMLALQSDFDVRIVSDHLTGDVADAARFIVETAANTPEDRPVALLFGGETTVRLTGTGLGGRNQELALRVAQLGSEHLRGDWCFLSGGTDGRDGPTEAAGGLVSPKTWQKIRAAGLDPEALLANNDSYAALKAAKALLLTGGTGTNVADVQIFLRQPS